MNILVIAHFQYDGSPYVSFVHDQVIAYKALGHNVSVISPVVMFKKTNSKNRTTYKKTIDGIKIYYPRYISLSKYGMNGINAKLGFLSVDIIVKRILNEFQPDIIHAHTIGFDGAIGVRLKEKYNIPVVISTHGTDTRYAVETKKISNSINICKKADALVAVSSKLKMLLNKFEANLDVKVINNGFRSQLCIDSKKKMHSIIQVGALIKQKKADITLKAIAEVKKNFSDVTITIVGEGNEKDNLLELCNQLKITDCVTFTGQISNKEVFERLSETEIFILPSVNEGFGIVYLEAMASGCVTIGIKGEGISEIISNDDNGFLVDADDFQAIAEYVSLCFQDNEYKKKIANSGKDSIRALTWENNAKEFIKLFEELIPNKG